MHKAISRTLWGVAFVGGLTVLGAGAAHAADTSGEDGVASGNQIGILGEAPVTIGGNAISILGDSESSGTVPQPASSLGSTEGTNSTSGQDGVLGGNQVTPDATAPVTVAGNAISVIGDSATAGAVPSNGTADGTSADVGAVTTGDDAIAGGNQVMPDATLPIVIGGNSITIVGDSTTEGTPSGAPTADGDTDGTSATTSGDDGIASGNQVAPDIDAPIVIGGNDVAVIRDDGRGDGVVSDGLLDGVLNDGLLDDLLQVDPIIGESVIGDSAIDGPLLGDTVVSDPVIGSVVDGPLIGDVTVLSPVETIVIADTAAVDDGASPGLNPLMVTAALTPVMMLAATGVEALPLIGGIALMLGIGLGLAAIKRMRHAVS